MGQTQEETAGQGRFRGQGPDKPVKISPWRDIFFKPRASVRWLLENESPASARMVWLSFTAFFIASVFLMVMLNPGQLDPASARLQIVLAIPAVFLFSLGFFLIESYLIFYVARLFGSKAGWDGIKIIFAFTNVIPGAAFILVNFLAYFLLGAEGAAASAVHNLIAGWSIVIAVLGLAEGAAFAVWRAIAVYIITIGLWVAAMSIIGRVLGTLVYLL